MGSTSNPPAIRFVLVNNPGRPTRPNASAHTETRAHAARVSHARNRLRRNVSTSSVKTTSLPSDAGSEANESPTISPSSDNTESPLMSPFVADHSNRAMTQGISISRSLNLFKGQSDPFRSYPISITPHINQTLAFMRDVLFPTVYDHNTLLARINPGYFSGAAVGDHFWQFCLEVMSTEGAALACVASYLAHMSTLMSDGARSNAIRVALVMSTKSSNMLQKSLHKNPDQAGPSSGKQVLFQISFLHRASLYIGDEHSTRVFGAKLNDLIMKNMSEGKITFQTVMHAAVDDADAATKFMCHTSIDFAWLGKTCEDTWTAVESELPLVPSNVYDGLHETVHSDLLRQIFIVWRHINSYAEAPVPQSAWAAIIPQRRLVYTWFAMKGVWAIGMAMNLFLDLQNHYQPNHEVTSGQRLTQAALALALVFQSRSMGHGTKINGIALRDYSAIIMSRLRPLMTEVFKSCTDDEFREYADAHLWILFMGAFWEQRGKGTTPKEPEWFQVHLVEKALLSRKAAWAKLEPVLKRFAYSSWEEPNGGEWFDDVAQEHMLRRQQQLQAEVLLAKVFP